MIDVRQSHSGISLISLMIGLLISMVAALGMLSLYSTVVRSTVESSKDARLGGERSNALLLAGMHLQGAGYGIEAPQRGTDLLLLDGVVLDLDSGSLSGGAPVTGSAPGNTLLWSAQEDGDRTCAGLYAPMAADQGGLYYLRPQPCAALSAAATWDAQPLIVDSSDAAGASSSVRMALLEHAGGGCQALGVVGSGRISVQLQTSERNGIPIVSTTCLLNYPAQVTTP